MLAGGTSSHPAQRNETQRTTRIGLREASREAYICLLMEQVREQSEGPNWIFLTSCLEIFFLVHFKIYKNSKILNPQESMVIVIRL